MSLFASKLFDERTFYAAFIKDLENCQQEVIIESPFVTSERMKLLRSIFERLVQRGVRIYIITRDPNEHSDGYEMQSELEIHFCEGIGVQVLLCVGNHHRKLAILDRKILWEGSLNILSQTHSREIMRRIDDEEITVEMFHFLKLSKFL